ncbi:hypothetical protein ACH0BF_19505 [Pseudobacillus sp. 179-B 2D1 NHS]|uniref:hypothetical protein n=1 Tax=Pseudobacillus sp. 179-B 2D1 NHS TaxID=3374292 RepID=UPI00387A7D0B
MGAIIGFCLIKKQKNIVRFFLFYMIAFYFLLFSKIKKSIASFVKMILLLLDLIVLSNHLINEFLREVFLMSEERDIKQTVSENDEIEKTIVEKNYNEMKELIKKIFKDDPLFNECQVEERTRDKLFPKFLGELSTSLEYRVPDIAHYIERSQSNIRYYLTSLPSYIGVARSGSSYRLKYDGVYRVYLICMYIRDLGKGLSDIKIKLGEDAFLIEAERPKKLPPVDVGVLNKKIDRLNQFNVGNLHLSLTVYKNLLALQEKSDRLNRLKSEVKDYDFKTKLNTIKIESLKLQKDQAERELDSSKRIAQQMLINEKRLALENEKKKSAGFFSRWKSVIVEQNEITQPSEEEIQNTEIVQERIKQLKDIESQLKDFPELTYSTDASKQRIAQLEEEVSVIKQQLEESFRYMTEYQRDLIDNSGMSIENWLEDIPDELLEAEKKS